jgi:hypothetical protein
VKASSSANVQARVFLEQNMVTAKTYRPASPPCPVEPAEPTNSADFVASANAAVPTSPAYPDLPHDVLNLLTLPHPTR